MFISFMTAFFTCMGGALGLICGVLGFFALVVFIHSISNVVTNFIVRLIDAIIDIIERLF